MAFFRKLAPRSLRHNLREVWATLSGVRFTELKRQIDSHFNDPEVVHTLNGWRFRDLKEHIDARFEELRTGVAPAPAPPPMRVTRPAGTGDEKLDNYLINGESVYGWLHQYSARFIAELSLEQSAQGIKGSLGEIGVHWGRLFILLPLTAQAGEKCFAIDVFGDQHLNIDQSGHGERDKFTAHLEMWASGTIGIEIIQKSSLDVAPAEILDPCGPCRLLSIDGGHTEELVVNDLRLAENILTPDGVAILDDVFNQVWPGVAAGASSYFSDPATDLRPFAITPNKLYVARKEKVAHYRATMERVQHSLYQKCATMFGHEVAIFGCDGQLLAAYGYH